MLFLFVLFEIKNGLSQVFILHSNHSEYSPEMKEKQPLLGLTLKTQQIYSRSKFLISCSLKSFKLLPNHLLLIIAAHSNK